MCIVEGAENCRTSIPRRIYRAAVTLTTMGYANIHISPITSLGQPLATMIMILGYGIIAVPTGIVTVELSHANGRKITTQACSECRKEGHDSDAVYCKYCGARL